MENELSINLQNTPLQLKSTLNVGIEHLPPQTFDEITPNAVTLKITHSREKHVYGTVLLTAERDMAYAFKDPEEIDRLISHLANLRCELYGKPKKRKGILSI